MFKLKCYLIFKNHQVTADDVTVTF